MTRNNVSVELESYYPFKKTNSKQIRECCLK